VLQIHSLAFGALKFHINEHNLARKPAQQQCIGAGCADVAAAYDGYAVE
jgi:hypothetical protein